MTTFLSILTLLSLGLAAYFWAQRRRYTRERFAFAGLSFMTTLTLFVLAALTTPVTPWEALLMAAAQAFGIPYTPQPLRTSDSLLAVIVVIFFGWLVLQILKHWDGAVSVAQREREEERQPVNLVLLVVESGLCMRDWLRPGENLLKRYDPGAEYRFPALEGAEANLVWHQQARELLQLTSRSYDFDVDADWHDQPRCWLGRHKQTGNPVVLVCWEDKPDSTQLEAWFRPPEPAGANQPPDRLQLLNTLQTLLPAEFEQVVFACNPPQAHLSTDNQTQRAIDLLRYAESRNELAALQQALPSAYAQSAAMSNPVYDGKESLTAYVHRIYARRNWPPENPEFIVAVKTGDFDETRHVNGHSVRLVSESRLLDGLVDFSDYFRDLRYRVESKPLTDSDLTIADTYTPSRYSFVKHGAAHDNIKDYLQNWLAEPGLRQLALLGEYGQGKSTASLLLSYHLITLPPLEQEENQSLPPFPKGGTRIPILIELRGKSPRTLSPQDWLATWAAPYGIDPRAVMKLLIAGRLLVILEGFDEIDLAGDAETRINHFRALWQLAYPAAKILITGRPNFFLDEPELKQALGIQAANRERPHCEALYLAPFDVAQIEHSLRHAEPRTRAEITALAQQDAKFRDIVARPSLLYLVAVLWHQEELAAHRENLNSAMVMDVFVRHSFRRQGAKGEKQDFMALTNAEREYFMAGIAVYMTVNQLPNQISAQQLDEVVRKLVEVIPDAVSKSAAAIHNETRTPLRQRFDVRNKEHLEYIKTDVRSCGLLVLDLSKADTFKFGHKSFMEFLTGKVFADYWLRKELGERERQVAGSLVNTLNFQSSQVFQSKESSDFGLDWLDHQVRKRSIGDMDVSKTLFAVVFKTEDLFNRLLAEWLKFGLRIAGQQYLYSGHKNVEKFLLTSSAIILIGILFSIVKVNEYYMVVILLLVFSASFLVSGAISGISVFTAAFLVSSTIFSGADAIVLRKNRNIDTLTIASAGSTIFGVVGLLALAGAKELGEFYMFFLFTLFYVLLSATFIGLPLGLLKGRRTYNPNSQWYNFKLWYKLCRRLNLSRDAIAGVIGEKALVLFETEEQDGQNQD